MTTRWCPPLPSIGRAGPRIEVLQSSTVLERLKEYFCEFRSVPDIFERRVSARFARRALRTNYGPRYLSEMSPGEQQSVLLRNLYFRLSASSRTKMRRRLDANALHQVRAWFQTADAVVLPLIIHTEYESPDMIAQVDDLVNWVLENCAHNYARFQSELKALKKRMRKSFALHGDIDHVQCPGFMIPYWRAARSACNQTEFSGPSDLARFVLLWCQTRATGVADHAMIRGSFEKFKETVTQAGTYVKLNPKFLNRVCRPAIGIDGRSAKVSVGTTACLEKTRREGGKTSQLKDLASAKSLRAEYDFRTLDETLLSEPRPVRSAKDLVNWAVYQFLHRPLYTSCVRVHAVAEPSKARTITVAPYAYQVIMGVFAHLFQPSLRARQIKSGLKADRHLWRFLSEVLNPQNRDWENLVNDNVYSLSTDLSEATDFGNRQVSAQIWQALIEAAENPSFPLGLAILAKTKYCGKRYAFLPDETNQNFELVVTQRGWMMGDMMTKVILTLAHQYCCEKSGLTVYTLVGDDEIALDASPTRLRAHLDTLGEIFKVSELDTFVSRRFAFYCEEGTLVPQRAQDTPHVRMRRNQELDYIDYPRIRLLLPTPCEVDSYSMSNIGRFALLGKEARWVHSTGKQARRYFDTAGLLQHLLVPQEPDTICPYTPIEIGGDGAFPPDGRFLRKVLGDKSRNPRETMFRMHDLINEKFSHRFVRSERVDKVVNKHHLYLPKIEKLREILPEDSILDASSPQTKALLQSFKFSTIKDPQSVFFEIAKGLYYATLLQGKDPVEPVFGIDREYARAGHSSPELDLDLFLEVWKNPGFKFRDSYGYYVDTTKIPHLNPMNLGWDWSLIRQSDRASRGLLEQWVHENCDPREASLPDILETIRHSKPLPDRVVQRLNLFIESDSYILHVLDRSYASERHVAIITRDQRLCKLVASKLNYWDPTNRTTVWAVDPVIWFTGRYGDFESLLRPAEAGPDWSIRSMEDPGAMLHVDYLEFEEGFPLDENVWDKQVILRLGRNSPVASLGFESHVS